MKVLFSTNIINIKNNVEYQFYVNVFNKYSHNLSIKIPNKGMQAFENLICVPLALMVTT